MGGTCTVSVILLVHFRYSREKNVPAIVIGIMLFRIKGDRPADPMVLLRKLNDPGQRGV